MQYHEQIKHPLWQKKRLEVLKSNDFQCQHCGDSEKELHVHHPYYKRGAMIWDYNTDELHVLCSVCHKEAHAIDEKIRRMLSDQNVCKDQIVGFLKSFTCGPHTRIESYEEAIGFMCGWSSVSQQNIDDFVNALSEVGGDPNKCQNAWRITK